MARQVLPTNFKDDVLAASMGGKRRYILTENDDGTFCLEDATTYTQEGSALGAARVNEICGAINESVDQATVVDDVDEIKAITVPGYVPGTLPLKQVISDLGTCRFGITEDGQYGYIVTGEDGADTVIPFSTFREAALKYIEDGTSYMVYASSVGCGHADNKSLKYMSFSYSESKSTYTVKAILSGYYAIVSSSGTMSQNYYEAGNAITTFSKYSTGAVIAL